MERFRTCLISKSLPFFPLYFFIISIYHRFGSTVYCFIFLVIFFFNIVSFSYYLIIGILLFVTRIQQARQHYTKEKMYKTIFTNLAPSTSQMMNLVFTGRKNRTCWFFLVGKTFHCKSREKFNFFMKNLLAFLFRKKMENNI